MVLGSVPRVDLHPVRARWVDASLFDRDEFRGLRWHDGIAVFGMVATIVAALLAIQVVRRVAVRQEDCLRAQREAWLGRA